LKPPTHRAVFVIIVLTVPIHIFVNVMAYLLRLKKTPW